MHAMCMLNMQDTLFCIVKTINNNNNNNKYVFRCSNISKYYSIKNIY